MSSDLPLADRLLSLIEKMISTDRCYPCFSTSRMLDREYQDNRLITRPESYVIGGVGISSFELCDGKMVVLESTESVVGLQVLSLPLSDPDFGPKLAAFCRSHGVDLADDWMVK